jgi:hypothetical protein
MTIQTTADSDVWRYVQEAGEASAGARIAAIVSGRPLPPASIICVEHAGLLWQAILAQCEKLVPGGRASMRTAGAYGTDGKSCSAFMSRSNEDGSSTAWFIQAYYDPARRREYRLSITVTGPVTDNHDREWERRIADSAPHVVCDHGWYTFGSGSSGRLSGGFGGRLFRWRDLATGAVTESRDMWFGGVVPPAWRERIPDTHEMLAGSPPAFTG